MEVAHLPRGHIGHSFTKAAVISQVVFTLLETLICILDVPVRLEIIAMVVCFSFDVRLVAVYYLLTAVSIQGESGSCRTVINSTYQVTPAILIIVAVSFTNLTGPTISIISLPTAIVKTKTCTFCDFKFFNNSIPSWKHVCFLNSFVKNWPIEPLEKGDQIFITNF